MKCKNCKADNKMKSICDAGIVCYVLRCGEYGCALNGKTVNKLLRMKKATTNADRLRAMTDEEVATMFAYKCCPPIKVDRCPTKKDSEIVDCVMCWLDWLRQEVQE